MTYYLLCVDGGKYVLTYRLFKSVSECIEYGVSHWTQFDRDDFVAKGCVVEE